MNDITHSSRSALAPRLRPTARLLWTALALAVLALALLLAPSIWA
jgi:hypothetical protein